MDLRAKNKDIIDKFRELEHKEDFSNPLLVSYNKEYIQNIFNSKQRILYIGQETNTWGRYLNNVDENTLSELYYEFLKNGATNKEFWLFIKRVLLFDQSKLIESIVWSNALIAGKNDTFGCPIFNNELRNLSLDYLKFLYSYFNPTKTIIVSGPSSPYYDVIKIFLETINSKLNEFPSKENPLVFYDNVYWTYHPQFLRRKSLTNDVINKITL